VIYSEVFCAGADMAAITTSTFSSLENNNISAHFFHPSLKEFTSAAKTAIS